MFAVRLLSLGAILLTFLGVALLTWLDESNTVFDPINRLNEVNAQYQAFANGVFLIAGIFWVGSVDTTRRTLEPRKMNTVLRFAAIAYAASYLLKMIFPCDQGCPASGSASQWLQTTVGWLLYAGPAVFAAQLWRETNSIVTKQFAGVTIMVFMVMLLDSFFLNFYLGLWQRSYELLFCILWWQYTSSLAQLK